MGFSLVLKTKGTVKCLGVRTSSFRMNNKRIGNIGEAKALAKFVELGIPVYIPFGDNESADLIAEFNGKLNKIQCKTTAAISEQSILLKGEYNKMYVFRVHCSPLNNKK